MLNSRKKKFALSATKKNSNSRVVRKNPPAQPPNPPCKLNGRSLRPFGLHVPTLLALPIF